MFNYCSSSVNIDGWDTSKVTDMSNMFNYFSGSVDISNLDTSNVTNVYYMLANTNTDNIILTGLSFPKCTKLDNIFDSAKATTLDLSSWDINNITNMNSMFSSANYKRIDLTRWNTNNVTNMYYMFRVSSGSLEELIIPDWDMTNVTNSSNFMNPSNMTKLKLIDLSRSNDATIIKIVSFLPTRTATTSGTVLVPENISQEAYDALIAKYWRPIGAAMTPAPTSYSIVAELDEIMPGYSTKVYLGSCEPWNADPSNVELILASDSSIATMDGNEVTSTGEVGNIEIAVRLIDTQEIIGTKIIVVSETDSYPNLVKFRIASAPSAYSAVITVNGSDKKLSALTYDSITDIYSYDAGTSITSFRFNSNSNINELVKLNICNITDMGYIFAGCKSLLELNLSNWDTSNVTTMNQMFYNCNNLLSLDLANFNTNNVTDMSYMFDGCTLLEELNISNFDTSNVTNKNWMLRGCTSLHTLRLDNCSNDTINKIITSLNFPTNVIEGEIRTIFCKEENAADLTPPTNWEFSFITEEEIIPPEVPDEGPEIIPPSVPEEPEIPLYKPGEFREDTKLETVETIVNETHDDLEEMFYNCYNLTSVNTKDWDTSNVRSMKTMFYNCTSLTSLDLGTWSTGSVTNMKGMFHGCSNLEKIDMRGFKIAQDTNVTSMFEGCTDLKTLYLNECNPTTVARILEYAGLPARENNDGIIYVSSDAYQTAKNIVPDGWTIFTE